jgi:hypothetical protein
MTDRKNGNGDTDAKKTGGSSPLDDITQAPEETEAAEVAFGEAGAPPDEAKPAPETPEETPSKETPVVTEAAPTASPGDEKQTVAASPSDREAPAPSPEAPEAYHSPAEAAVEEAGKKKKNNKPLIITCCSCLFLVAAAIIIILVAGVLTEMNGTSESGYLNGPGDSARFLVESDEPTLTITFEYPDGEADFWVYVSDEYGNMVVDWWDLDVGTVLTVAGNQNYYVTIHSVSGSGDWSASW